MDISALVATLTSVLAIGLTIVLLRLQRQDRQRSDARVAALVTLSAAPSAFEPPPVRLQPKPRQTAAAGDISRHTRPLNAADVEIFRDTAPSYDVSISSRAPELFAPSVPRQRNAMVYIGAAALAMAGLIALSFGWAFSSAGLPADETTATIGAPPAAIAAPLALLALRHEQGADGTLVISGIVRNPAESIARQKLFAAASLVDTEGAIVATARAPLDFTLLGPGEESPFVVRVSGAGSVARYRIGFRDAEGASIAHIDRR
ncbi:MAG: hypothetical protein WD690_05110 [Vicinamibacterales bacterium]